MKQEYRDAWIEALRSGKYKQARSALRTNEGHCCLGVYAEVRGMTITKDGCNIEIDGEQAGYEPIEKEIGIELDIFWRKNDGAGVQEQQTFAQIADYIEENVEAT